MLPVQRSQVPSLVRELDPTCHNYEIGHAATKTSYSQINKLKKKKKLVGVREKDDAHTILGEFLCL